MTPLTQTTPSRPAPASRARSDAEARQLFERWQHGGDTRAREQLVERYLPLARKLARRYVGANEPIEDLVQVASLALLKAIDRFDPDRERAFTSFAVPTILGELRRYFRDSGWSVHVPRGAQERALAVEKAIKALSARACPTPSVQTLAEYLEWSIDDVLEGLEARAGHHATSLDAPTGASDQADDGLDSLLETFGRNDEGYDAVDARLTLRQAISQLPPSTRRIIALRFAEDLTQAEIGERVGVSQMQVSRVLKRALEQLRGSTGQ